jgi:hypothetical protein
VPDVGVLLLGGDEGEPLAGADGALEGAVLGVEQAPAGARRVGPQVAAEQPQERGLPGAARAQDPEPLSGADGEGDAREERRAREADVDAIEGDERARHVRILLSGAPGPGHRR